MFFLKNEDSRLIKAWDVASEHKEQATLSMAPAPQGTFWICAKVGDLDPDLRNMYPADNLADKIAAKMGAYDWGYLSFEEVADQLEKGWAEMVSHDTQGFFRAY